MPEPTPFAVNVPQAEIDAVLAKVRAYRWHEMPRILPGEDRWAFGTDMDYLRELCAHWVEHYDWRRGEAALNRFPQFKATVDGQEIHFLHVAGSGRAPETVVLTHGWPGSVLEFLDVVEPLAHPERFGGDAEDGVTLVIPALPGYGFSGKPERPIGPRRIAALWDRLLREVLGCDGYVAQGGDWGSMVSGWLGLEHPVARGGGCRAVHLNMFGLQPAAPPRTPEELEWAAKIADLGERERGYSHEQATKPQTLSYGMMDSPVGAAAWIVEKFHTWSDKRRDGRPEHVENAFDRDRLLDNLMVYLLTRSFNTATWLYRGAAEEGSRRMPPGGRVTVPTAVARFPAEPFLWAPRSLVEQGYAVARWTDMPRGGHFAALETGTLFADDLRAFVRQLRGYPQVSPPDGPA